MSDNSDNAWPNLTLVERRILGVMVEKAKTTPDAYPLSLNALVTGCNQKSNRDPVLNLAEEDIDQNLQGLQKQGLVTRITGGRVDRWRHNLYDVWKVDKVELAILTELFLRGPQTEGELRGHASRMEPIDDLEKLREVLQPMKERKLIVFLGPEGRRGTAITHCFQAATDLERLRIASASAQAEAPASGGRSALVGDQAFDLETVLAELRGELAAVRSQVQQVQNELQQVRDEMQRLVNRAVLLG